MRRFATSRPIASEAVAAGAGNSAAHRHDRPIGRRRHSVVTTGFLQLRGGRFRRLRCSQADRTEKTLLALILHNRRALYRLRGAEVRSVARRRLLSKPDLPRSTAFGVELVKVLLVLERVHRGDEPFIWVSEQLFHVDETLKWCLDELFARAHVVENLAPEHKEPGVDPEICVSYGLDFAHTAIRQPGDCMKAQIRPDANEVADSAPRREPLNHRW